MAIIIATVARKGGVGKSLITSAIAAHLSEQTKAPRVLLIDCDGQNSLTSYFLKGVDCESLPNEATASAFFDESVRMDPNKMIHPTSKEGMFIVPANESLTYHNWPNIPEQPENRRRSIRNFAKGVGHHFDYVIIDTGPTLRCLPNYASLVAADYVICPTPPEAFAGRGIAPVQRFVEAARMENPELHLLGYIVNLVDNRWSSHRENRERLELHHGARVFETVIPRLSDFQSAIDERTPITDYKGNGNAAQLTEALTREVLLRIREHRLTHQSGKEAA